MRRRELLAAFGGGLLWPVAATAQQKSVPVIGFVSSRSPADSARELIALHDGLREQGYREGQNLAVEYRWANGNYDLLPRMATELVTRKVRLIVTAGAEPAALAAREATSATAIPFVFMINGDPVRLGLVNSIKRPGVMRRAFRWEARPSFRSAWSCCENSRHRDVSSGFW